MKQRTYLDLWVYNWFFSIFFPYWNPLQSLPLFSLLGNSSFPLRICNDSCPPLLPFLLQSGTTQLQSHGKGYAGCALFLRAIGQEGQWGLKINRGLIAKPGTDMAASPQMRCHVLIHTKTQFGRTIVVVMQISSASWLSQLVMDRFCSITFDMVPTAQPSGFPGSCHFSTLDYH